VTAFEATYSRFSCLSLWSTHIGIIKAYLMNKLV